MDATESMDYTMEGMDDSQRANPPQCQNTNLSGQNNFNMHQYGYPGLHYDPVHNGYVSHLTQSQHSQHNSSDRGGVDGGWAGFSNAPSRSRGFDDMQMGYMGRRPTSSHPWEQMGDYNAPPGDYNAAFGYASDYLPSYSRTSESNHSNRPRNTTTQAPLNNVANTRSSQRYSANFDIHNNHSLQVSQNQSSPNNYFYVPNGSTRPSRTTTREDVRPALQPAMSSSYGGTQSQNTASASALPGRRRRSDWDSDEDDEEGLFEDREEIRRLSMSVMDGERGMAMLRAARDGQKRIVSQAYVDKLEELDVGDLGKEDKNCIICYNALGVKNPDGLIEKPVRLPKCKHVFGDKCIKEWFGSSDHCPYCRDKLPSQIVVSGRPRGNAALAAQFLHERRLGGTNTAAMAQFDGQDYLASLMASEELIQESPHAGNSGRLYTPAQWSPPPSSRAAAREAAVRRQSRARLQARPTSIGGSRNLPSANTYRHYSPATPHYPPGLQRHSSDRSSNSTANSLPVGQLPNSGTFSPPVAVGSGVLPSDLGSAQSRRSLPGTFETSSNGVNNPQLIGSSSAAVARNNSYGSQRFGRIERHLAMARAVENIPPSVASMDETLSPPSPYV